MMPTSAEARLIKRQFQKSILKNPIKLKKNAQFKKHGSGMFMISKTAYWEL